MANSVSPSDDHPIRSAPQAIQIDANTMTIPGDGRYDFICNDIIVETLIQNTHLRNGFLFILLSGARDPSRHPLPKFDRWKWVHKFPGVTVNISDPSFRLYSPGLRIGWYCGDNDNDFSEIIATVISRLAQFYGLPISKVILYGSSAGGFAALSIASSLEGSTAVCINGQVRLQEYIPSAFNKFIRACFNSEPDKLSPEILNRFDVAHRFAKSSSKCLFVQNLKDHHHFKKHYTYFCDTLGVNSLGEKDFTKRVWTLPYSAATEGHGPEPINMVDAIIADSIALSRYQPTSIHSGFKANIGTDSSAKKRNFNAFAKSFILFRNDRSYNSSPLLSQGILRDNLGDYLLWTSHDQKISSCSFGQTIIFIVGICMKSDNFSLDENDISELLAKNWSMSKKGFHVILNKLCGSFSILIIENGKDVTVFPDACATYSIFYSQPPHDLIISSHSTLIAYFLGIPCSDFSKRWISNPAFKLGGAYYPGNLSEFDNVKLLTPNTYLASRVRQPIRFWPCIGESLTYDDRHITAIIKILKGQIKSLVNKYNVTCSLSGGLDSRLSLAASAQYSDSIEFFTYSIRGNRSLALDLEISREISELLKLNHKAIRIEANQPIDLSTYQQLNNLSPGNFANADLISAYIRHFGCMSNRVHIRSNLMEIGRGYFLKNKANLGNRFDAHKLSALFRRATKEELTPIFSSFSRDAQYDILPLDEYHYTDIFYWEHRMGCFLGQVCKRERPIHETISLFNCRNLLNMILSPSIDQRTESIVFWKLIELMCPQLLDVPFSSGGKYFSYNKYLSHSLR
jgi:hypothetical protein